MSLIRCSRLNFTLNLEKVREKMLSLDPKALVMYSPTDNIRLELKPIYVDDPKPGLKYIKGVCWYTNHKYERREAVKVYGTIADWKDNKGKDIQSISLNTLNGRYDGGKYLEPDLYKEIDAFLFRALKVLFCYAVDVNISELEFIEPSENDSNGHTAEAINIGAWGKQSCGRFEWSMDAEALRATGAELHRYCSRCTHIDNNGEKCATAIQIAANRKKSNKEEIPVAATSEEEHPYEGIIDPDSEGIICSRDGMRCTETCYCKDCKREVK
jgi:hypothetical protein